MPLTDEEWRAFVNEHNAAMTDVEADLHASLDGLRSRVRALLNQGMVSDLESDSLLETAREDLLRAQARLNAYSRRLVQMRKEGEL